MSKEKTHRRMHSTGAMAVSLRIVIWNCCLWCAHSALLSLYLFSFPGSVFAFCTVAPYPFFLRFFVFSFLLLLFLVVYYVLAFLYVFLSWVLAFLDRYLFLWPLFAFLMPPLPAP